MLSQSQRAAILELNAQKVSKHEIARVLKVSRLTVREVLRSGSSEVPSLPRTEKYEPYRQQILELHVSCKGNLVRVWEELQASGATLSYQALTSFCRRHGIGQVPKVAPRRHAKNALHNVELCITFHCASNPTLWNAAILLRSLLLCSNPTRLLCSRNTSPSFWRHHPFCFGNLGRCVKGSLEFRSSHNCSSDESTGLLELGNFGVDKGENVVWAHAKSVSYDGETAEGMTRVTDFRCVNENGAGFSAMRMETTSLSNV
jgi:hypothetical protein